MPSQPDLEESVNFVLYHLWMLRECARMPRPAKRILRNLWYEGLALHSRVLRDVFYTKFKDRKRNTRPSDVVAVDYFATPASWTYTSANLSTYLAKVKKRMDCALAHITTDRIALDKGDKDWDAKALEAELFDKWFEFIAKLELENLAAATWFRQHRRARLVPFSPSQQP